MTCTVYTVGHSTQTVAELIDRLKRHGITAIGDVRSMPYSRMNPQFNREAVKEALAAKGIAYVFLGKELGARSDDPACYEQGKVQYDRLAQTELFQQGLDRVEKGAEQYRIALMCAEKDPLACHRTILVSRHLEKRGLNVEHILADGELESHPAAIARLRKQLGIPDEDLFSSQGELEAEAYRRQGEKIAYEEQTAPGNDRDAIGDNQ